MKHFLHADSKNRTYLLLVSIVSIVSLGVSSFSPVLVSANASSQNTAKVSFTFDDGLSSALLAAQTLQQDGYAGTDYIITQCVGMKAPDTCAADETKDYMSWSDIHTLNTTYGWEIGSHTQTHPLTAAIDNPSLTDTQLDTEMSGSKADLAANGFNATDFASPYGDYDNRSLAVIAKYYASHRAFQDYEQPTDPNDAVTPTFPYYSPRDSYPYNNYLLTVEEVQGNIPVATVEGYVDQAIANHQWLILVFHNIMASGASTNETDYQYNASDLKTIADYVKSKNIPVVTVKNGLANGTNIMSDSGFNDPIGTYASPNGSTGWTTDAPAAVQNDQQATSLAGHGSYDGTAEGPLNSVAVNNTTGGQAHLFSPLVAITPGTTYTLTNFVNITSTTGSINFYIDEYDANGAYVNYMKAVGPIGSTDTNNVQVGDVNFIYTPSASNVAFAHVYADIAPGTTGYIDNMEWLTPNANVVPPKPGDVNGDGLVNIKDAALVSLNWGKTGATLAQGDVNGDGLVNIKDAALVSLNWGK